MAMANVTHCGGGRWRLVGWGFAVLLLATPFVAMQFTSDVAWTAGDFLLAALMLGVFGLALELTFKFTSDSRFRTGNTTNEIRNPPSMFLIHADDESPGIRLFLLAKTRELRMGIGDHRPKPGFLEERRL